jgi:hypothetical protein
MPKNNKKGKGKDVSMKVEATAPNVDDDLDEILAEIMAEDMQQLPSDSGNLPTFTAGSSVISDANSADVRAAEVDIPEVTIIAAVRRGDTAQLKRWGRQGVLVKSVAPLRAAVSTGASNAVLRILVRELNDDINQSNECGHTSMQCLAKELGADVTFRNKSGYTLFLYVMQLHGAISMWSAVW